MPKSKTRRKGAVRPAKLSPVLALVICLIAAFLALRDSGSQAALPVSMDDIPAYSGEAYVEINGGEPFFTESDWTTDAFETYSELDELGRCGVAYANICQEIMPAEPRGKIGSVKPSGWHTIRYNGLVEGNYLYNRCHLIGYQLAGENANPKNLITGTRYLNTTGMLPFENEVNDYVDETDNHVLYRVTPVFEGDDLVASGVLMEAYSVEDEGVGVQFCVYCYNVQPGVVIDYATGESWLEGETAAEAGGESAEETYVLNTKSMKFHRPDCSGAQSMSSANRQDFTGSRETLLAEGYSPCGQCKP